MKKSIISLAILVVGLSSCSRSDEGVLPGQTVQTGNVSLKLSTAPLTRAAGTPESGTTDPVVFNEGILYFVSSENHSIVHRVSVQSTPVTPTQDENGRTNLIGLSGTEITEVTIQNIPVEEGYRVFMVGNPSQAIKGIIGGSFTEVEKAVISVISENQTAGQNPVIDGGVSNVTLYGYGTIEKESTTSSEGETIHTYSAEVEVGPAVTARIEIPSLRAKNDVASFQLDGIYIGRTYLQVGLNGKAMGEKIGDTSDAIELMEDYEDLAGGILHDKFTTGIASANGIVTAGSGQVWAYNVLTYNPYYAGGSDLDEISGYVDNMPSIIFVLSDLQAAPGKDVTFDNSKPYYITVQGFLRVDQNNELIEVLEPGYIYNVLGVEVDGTTVTDKPNVERVNVEVEVKLMGWIDENVAPVI